MVEVGEVLAVAMVEAVTQWEEGERIGRFSGGVSLGKSGAR